MGHEFRRTTLVLTAGLVLVLTVLAVLVARAWGPLIGFDTAAVAGANALIAPHPTAVGLVTSVTDAGSPVSVDVLTAVAVVGLLAAHRFPAAIYLTVVRLLDLGVETVLKDVLDRPRPVPAVVLETAQGAAFPSGHTAGTAALCVSVLVLALPVLRTRGRAVAVLAGGVAVVVVAASRVLLGVHYPSDVLGGALTGVVCALAAALLLRPARRGDLAARGRV